VFINCTFVFFSFQVDWFMKIRRPLNTVILSSISFFLILILLFYRLIKNKHKQLFEVVFLCV